MCNGRACSGGCNGGCSAKASNIQQQATRRFANDLASNNGSTQASQNAVRAAFREHQIAVKNREEDNTMRSVRGEEEYTRGNDSNSNGNFMGTRFGFDVSRSGPGCIAVGDVALGYMQDKQGFRWHETEPESLAPIYTNAGVVALGYDYSCLGPKAVGRAAAQLMHGAGGIYSVNYFASVAGVGVQTATVDPSVIAGIGDQLSLLGFVLDWGISLANYAPFNAILETDGFTSMTDGVDTDRTMELRFTGGVLGGRLYVPLAYRSSTGMNYGQNVLSRLRKNGNVWDTATVKLKDLTTAITSALSFTVQPITAFSPQFADYARVTGLAVGMGGLDG